MLFLLFRLLHGELQELVFYWYFFVNIIHFLPQAYGFCVISVNSFIIRIRLCWIPLRLQMYFDVCKHIYNQSLFLTCKILCCYVWTAIITAIYKPKIFIISFHRIFLPSLVSFWFITRQGLIQYIKLAVITQQNVLHCIVQYVIQLHVSALFLGHRQVVSA